MNLPPFKRVYGIDFSGARLAGLTAWRAVLDTQNPRPRLIALASLASLAGSAAREVVFPWLVADILAARAVAVGIDAPFSMPLSMTPAATYRDELSWVSTFRDARAMGRTLADDALLRFGVRHVRRETDRINRTPFDSYHYRIVYQTFHVMRDVCRVLSRDAHTAILPFDYTRLGEAERVVVETCPSSTLKRLGLPFRGYKQPGKAPVAPEKVKVRAVLLAALRERMEVPAEFAEQALLNPGGDALDAILAAWGTFESLSTSDHECLRSDAQVCREGWVYA